MAYKEGQKVEYRPIGGGSDNVSTSTGTITKIDDSEGDTRYTIKNDNTGKETSNYQEKNIVGKSE